MTTIYHSKFKGITKWKALLFILFFSLTSCDSFVEVDLPNSQLTGPTVFKERATADAAMGHVYANIRDQGLLSGTSFGLSCNLGAYADELDFYGDTSYSTLYFYNNNLLPSNTAVGNYWNTAYNQIYAANAIYEGIQTSTTLSSSDSNNLKGEALFVRGLLHFYLANLYGNIPYVTTTDYRVNSTVSRLSISEVYKRIQADLEQAVLLLPDNYFTSGRARPNKSAANALLARCYLYSGSWAEAANAASTVLNQTNLYQTEPNLEKVFLNECTETIWQLPPAAEGRNTDEAATFTLFSGPPLTFALSDSFMEAFSPNDLRRTFWIGEVTNGSHTWFYPRKYKQTTVAATASEYAIVLRLPEQYLIRAEARVHQEDLIGAKEDLNQVRQRAGIGETTALSKQQLLEAILLERRLELFTEYGHRFFDLKRNGKLDAVLSTIKIGWNSNDSLLPIPESELSVNPNLLPQNPGY
ncbi:RagB/SusD family nutrient uptake outer membrane protein [Flavobacterium sp. ZS1P70]|uniref:RagB/SusD family nutrient uptake outer membrane protein n=1 Tax=Flavobacterium zhoui TaxID=3230414 RepID=A0ABW6I7E0_9FLAO